MPLFLLNKNDLTFPDPHLALPDGLLAIGGDLRPERVLLAYRSGIFPWYSGGELIQWWSPDPRFVLYLNEVHIPRSLTKVLTQKKFTLQLDTDFVQTIQLCAKRPRQGQGGTWITQSMQRAYIQLFEQGYAHSAEAWIGDRLVGGLYGVSLGNLFFGESMFYLVPDASKAAFAALTEQLCRWGFGLIDSQLHTHHVERFGGRHISRIRYLEELEAALQHPTRKGRWVFDDHFGQGWKNE
ncbi:MAG: leucyl/phenylalanyl-tRNA--protein transferase [Myxococcales bacterium]|nr:leucyl/phenylalanyl-tRNA--protein transferase [Myxococcales bacterium]